VILMLTGGVVPCLQPWPITKIKLQGKYAGYDTDDFIAFVESRDGIQRAKLLAQIKHSVAITESDPVFSAVIQAAWNDFQSSDFKEGVDAIALITGPMSSNDIEHARVILEWARHSASANEFIEKVSITNFSSETKREKLKAFRSQLAKANKGKNLDDETFWRFLKVFHLLGYDLDAKSGVTLALLHSHIAQFDCGDVPGFWAKVTKEVAFFNQSAGTITQETISEELRSALIQRAPVAQMPPELLAKQAPGEQKAAGLSSENASALMYASLLGSWNEKSQGDLEAIDQLLQAND